MSKRKKISQREAMRMRKQLRELGNPHLSHGEQIFMGDFQLHSNLRGVVSTAMTCEHLVICKCEGNALTFYAYKP